MSVKHQPLVSRAFPYMMYGVVQFIGKSPGNKAVLHMYRSESVREYVC